MRRAGVCGALLALGCGEVTPPDRSVTYAFGLDCAQLQGACAGPENQDLRMVFHWPAAALPVRVWVQPGTPLPDAAEEAANTWSRTLLHRPLDIRLVPDSLGADVHIMLLEAEAFPPGDPAQLDCGGFTRFTFAADSTVTLPFRTFIRPRSGAGGDDLTRCFHAVVLHEMGHSLGLLRHSADPGDIMHQHPTATEPSLADRATLALLYHTDPTIRVPAGR